MVRSLVSVGVILACGWSALSGVAQAGTLTVISDPVTNGGSYVPVSNHLNVNNMPGGIVITPPPELIWFSPIVPPPITQPPLVPPPSSIIPPPNGELIIKRPKALLPKGWGSSFYGVIQGTSEQKSGYVRFVLNRAGRGSASVTLNGDPKPVIIPIQMDEAGNVAPVNGSNSAGVSVSGTLAGFSDGSVGFDTVITNKSQRTPVRVLSAKASSEAIAAVKGRYTLVFENDTGGVMLYTGVTGFGVLQINKRGYVVFSGRLSDGTKFSQGTQLNSAGKWALYSKASNSAILSGNTTFADLTDSDCSALLQWQRQFNGRVIINQSADVTLRGSRYDAAEAFGDAAQWQFEARTGSGSFQATGTLIPKNALRITSSGADKARFTLTKASGKLSGSFIRSGNPTPQAAQGIVFQKTGEGFGLTKARAVRAATATIITTPTWSGRFTLDATGVATSDGFMMTDGSEVDAVPAVGPSSGVIQTDADAL